MNYNTGETIDETFTYDAAGNIITASNDGDTDSFVYDENNRVIYYNGADVSYDADGNMTSAYHDGSRRVETQYYTTNNNPNLPFCESVRIICLYKTRDLVL